MLPFLGYFIFSKCHNELSKVAQYGEKSPNVAKNRPLWQNIAQSGHPVHITPTIVHIYTSLLPPQGLTCLVI
jgi:hypothetical protein